ncbi:MAG: hypothetical protein KJ889_04715 [Gammaproteobacteria bacterium]|nr:hypothetical protein [Gammaproteobacteria bacterium]
MGRVQAAESSLIDDERVLPSKEISMPIPISGFFASHQFLIRGGNRAA